MNLKRERRVPKKRSLIADICVLATAILILEEAVRTHSGLYLFCRNIGLEWRDLARSAWNLWRQKQYLEVVDAVGAVLATLAVIAVAIALLALEEAVRRAHGRVLSMGVKNLARRACERTRVARVPAVASATLLLVSVSGVRWPSGFYLFLSIVVFSSALYLSTLFRSLRREIWMWLMVGVAILFNPLFPLHFHRHTWQIIDPVCAVLFAYSLLFRKRRDEYIEEERTKMPTKVEMSNLVHPLIQNDTKG